MDSSKSSMIKDILYTTFAIVIEKTERILPIDLSLDFWIKMFINICQEIMVNIYDHTIRIESSAVVWTLYSISVFFPCR